MKILLLSLLTLSSISLASDIDCKKTPDHPSCSDSSATNITATSTDKLETSDKSYKAEEVVEEDQNFDNYETDSEETTSGSNSEEESF